MGTLEGKVAFITGAARGQGRSHAIRLAQEGAHIIAADLCADVDTVPYPLATSADLADTVAAVEALGSRIISAQADVRDRAALQAVVDRGVAELGPIDIILANAGVAMLTLDPAPNGWYDVLDINLTGVYHTVEVGLPSMIGAGRGGSVVLTSSTAGIIGIGGNSPGGLGYTASKHGVVGLMRAYANYYAAQNIRVNAIHPTGVDTDMVTNDAAVDYLAQDSSIAQALSNALPVEVVESSDISNAIAWLVSDAARYVTGISLPIDAGFVNKR